MDFPFYNAFVGAGVALGYLAADTALANKPERRSWPSLCLFAMSVGALGSMCFSHLVGAGKASHSPAFTFLGGAIPAAMMLGIAAKVSSLNVWLILDAGAFGLCAGHALGRLGCVMGGCCYGRVTALGSFGEFRFPTPLIEAVCELCIYLYLKIAASGGNLRAGQIAAKWMILYGVLRFSLEFTRGDFRGVLPLYTFGITPSQALSLVLIVMGLLTNLHVSHQRNTIRNV